MSRRKRNNAYWSYLESSGVLENGSEEEIQKVKRAYRKKYLNELKRKHRSLRPEFIVGFNKANGEYEKVRTTSEKHSLKIPSFIRMATLAYINKTFVTPQKAQVYHLEQILADCLNKIQTITTKRERFHWERDRKLEHIEEIVEKLERDISEVLRYPVPVEQYIAMAIKKDPALSNRLLTLLTHDSKNKIS